MNGSLNKKKVLVTGADGFIGSHLTEMLSGQGADVRALSYYNSFNSWGWLETISCLPQVEVVAGDIRDGYFLNEITRGVEVIFHLAALIGIPYSYVAPDSYVQTNVVGTLNVLKAAMANGVQRVVHTSTSEVYGSAKYVPIDEEHPLQPQSPYSASKIAADSLAESFHRSFELPVVIVRPFNTYGPRQSARAVIPTVITQILCGAKSIKIGNLGPTRDFNYVEETCRGFVELMACDEAVGKTVNVGSNQEISIGELVDLIKKLMGSEILIENDEPRIRPSKSEVSRLRCDNTKLVQLTGFKPTIGLREGLAMTIEWLSRPDNLRKYKAGLYNV